MPANGMPTVLSFTITEEERSTNSMVPVAGTFKHQIRATESKVPLTGTVKHQIRATQSTASLIKPGEMISNTKHPRSGCNYFLRVITNGKNYIL